MIAFTSNLFLQQAVVNGDVSALKQCLKSGMDSNVFDDDGEPLLFTAIVNGDMEILTLLMTQADVNMTSKEGRTALMIAVEMNDMEMIRKLLKAGAWIDSRDNSGKTPLLLALENGRFKIAEYLIKRGSDVNSVDHLGQSALTFVVNADRTDSSKIVKILFYCGYVLKESDSWLCLDYIVRSKLKKSNYTNLFQKMVRSLKIISKSGESDMFLPES